jgi:hypothetical protein
MDLVVLVVLEVVVLGAVVVQILVDIMVLMQALNLVVVGVVQQFVEALQPMLKLDLELLVK